MTKISQATVECLREVAETGILRGKCKMVEMVRNRGFVERTGVDHKNHSVIFSLTDAGRAALAAAS